jgi:hypothetical protein
MLARYPEFRPIVEGLVSARSNNKWELTVEAAAAHVPQSYSESEAAALVRRFYSTLEREEAVGQFVVGRRGKKSRFKWSVPMLAYLRQLLEKASPGQGSLTNLLRYPYALRAGFVVDLTLPADLTSREAERLCKFIQSIPADADAEGESE